MKKLIVFDLDGTLAPSKAAVDSQMARLLLSLMDTVKIGVISGGGWSQFETQVLGSLDHDPHLENLSILPTCGTKFYQYRDGWKKLYDDLLTPDQKAKIVSALQKASREAARQPDRTWGDVIEDRGSQITYSGLGQQAPLEEKIHWDPGFLKRKNMLRSLERALPEFSVRIGGTTSIDVAKHGVDKSYGIRKLKEILHIELSEMVFVGDAIFPGGNDYPVQESGVVSIRVRGPEETKRVIEAMIACLDVSIAEIHELAKTELTQTGQSQKGQPQQDLVKAQV